VSPWDYESYIWYVKHNRRCRKVGGRGEGRGKEKEVLKGEWRFALSLGLSWFVTNWRFSLMYSCFSFLCPRSFEFANDSSHPRGHFPLAPSHSRPTSDLPISRTTLQLDFYWQRRDDQVWHRELESAGSALGPPGTPGRSSKGKMIGRDRHNLTIVYDPSFASF
jgi:hypothetical protein